MKYVVSTVFNNELLVPGSISQFHHYMILVGRISLRIVSDRNISEYVIIILQFVTMARIPKERLHFSMYFPVRSLIISVQIFYFCRTF